MNVKEGGEPRTQRKRFEQAARELECDDDPERFAERVRKIAKAPPAPHTKTPKAPKKPKTPKKPKAAHPE